MKHPSKVAYDAGCDCDRCHPSSVAYRSGCRCARCDTANRRQRKRFRVYGGGVQVAAPYTDHVRALVAEGFCVDSLSRISGIDRNELWAIHNGTRTKIRRHVAAKLRTLTRESAIERSEPWAWVPIIGATRRLQALSWMGWHTKDIAAGTAKWTALSATRDGKAKRVTAANWRFIDDAFARLSFTVGPSESARRLAIRKGWAPPLAWDAIDDPDATPDYGAPEPTAAERDATMRALYEQGMSDAQIGEAVNRSRDTVRHWRNRRGLPAIDVTAANLGEERDDRLALWQQGLTDREIADRIGRHPDVVRRWRSRHGLESRTERKRKDAA